MQIERDEVIADEDDKEMNDEYDISRYETERNLKEQHRDYKERSDSRLSESDS